MVPDLPAVERTSPEQQAEAERAYDSCATLYEEGRIADALVAAELVYKLMPNASTALMRAQLLEAAGRPCAAFAALAVALDMDPSSSERIEIGGTLQTMGKACKPGAAWARIRVSPEAALVRISGREVPAGRTVVLRAGIHPVEVEAPGYARLRATLKADPGEEVPASFETERLGGAAAPASGAPGTAATGPPGPRVAAPAPVHEPAPRSTALPWLLTAGGAAAGAAGLGFNLWALDAASKANDLKDPQADLTLDERERRYGDEKDKATSRRTIAYVLYGAGGAALVAGVVWLLASGDGDVPAGWMPSVWVLEGGAGVSFGGSL